MPPASVSPLLAALCSLALISSQLLAATPAATSGSASSASPEIRALYAQRCAACHEQSRPDVPSRQKMATRKAAFIIEKLAFGSMQTQALGLGDVQIEQIASYLTADNTSRAAAPATKPYLTLEELRTKYADRTGRYARIGGVEVYHKDEGRGAAILLIHGSQSTLRTWDYVAPVLLRRGYRVIRYDMPPLGLSGPVSDQAAGTLTPAAFVAGLLDHLGVDRVTCVGVSSGGTTCMYFAAAYPDRVNRLIMSNSPSDPVENARITATPEFENAQREARETGFQSQRFWNAFLDFFSGDPRRLDAGIREQYYDINRRVPEKNYTALTGLVRDREKATSAMALVRAPTLLIWGARDQLLPPRAADILAGYLKNTQVSKILMPDVGHYPPLESPARFAQLLLAYLEAATPVAAPP